jgi:hypothetical protein
MTTANCMPYFLVYQMLGCQALVACYGLLFDMEFDEDVVLMALHFLGLIAIWL